MPFGRTVLDCFPFAVYTSPPIFGIIFFPMFWWLLASVALVWKSQRDSIVTLGLIITLLVLVFFPIYFVVKSCFEESMVATKRIVDFVNSNTEFQVRFVSMSVWRTRFHFSSCMQLFAPITLQELMNDYQQSTWYKKFVAYAASWGWDVAGFTPEKLKEYLLEGVQILGNNVNVIFGSSFMLMSNIGSMITSGIVFLSCLFYVMLVRSPTALLPSALWHDCSHMARFTIS
jgi:hypothetical protein